MPRDHSTALTSTPPENSRSIVDNSPREAAMGVCAERYAPVSVYSGFVADVAPDAGFSTSVVVVPTRL
jgi:hypothetical protein